MRITEWMAAARRRTLTLVNRTGRIVEIRHRRGYGWTVSVDGRPRRLDQVAVEDRLDALAMRGYRQVAA